ncbi:MAG: hypothetical protein OEZ52_09590 [Candidatus Aminicenantes bacterium]|nr:hypothetical protein [Candidatus Aminicenantes bacterium]MDH5743787.1 hypothetical protein [Candidatus Aminicenantes bacterium]
MKKKALISSLTLGLFLLVFFSCPGKGKKEALNEQLMIGIKIYDYEGDLTQLFEEWRSLGINTAFVGESLLPNRNFHMLAKKFGIKVFVIIPIFYDPEELHRDPDLYAITHLGETAIEEWVEFVCPTRENYREQRITHIKKAVQELNPDGISIDFIRYFVFWEKVYPDRSLNTLPNTCFDNHCLLKFQKETGIEIPEQFTSVLQKAEWIMNNHSKEWTEWKCSVITGMVQEITKEAKKIKPNILVNVHAVPWRQKDYGGAIKIIAGQDLAGISAHTDFISPMCYSHMLKRKPNWISSVVEDMGNLTHSRIVPSIQVKEAYLNDILSESEFKAALDEALKPPSRGVIFWSWDGLEKDPEKKLLIKSLLNNQMEKDNTS